MKKVTLYKGYAIFRGILMFGYAALLLIVGFVGRSLLFKELGNDPVTDAVVSLVDIINIIFIIEGLLVAVYFIMYVIGVKRTLSGNGKGKVLLTIDFIFNIAYAVLGIAACIYDGLNKTVSNNGIIFLVSALGLVYDLLAVIAIKRLNSSNS